MISPARILVTKFCLVRTSMSTTSLAATASSVPTMHNAEVADSYNWFDNFSSPPSYIQEALGLAASWDDEMTMVRSVIPYFHFNMATAVGTKPVTSETFDKIAAFFNGKVHHVTVVEPFDKKPDADREFIESELASRGYTPSFSFDRVILEEVTPTLQASWEEKSSGAELVTAETSKQWSDFITQIYGMPPIIGEWLQHLVGRPGWYHGFLRKEDGAVAMARSIYVHSNGWAWLGIDAPVPGTMAPCYDDDLKVCALLMNVASKNGARSFVSDVELPNDERSGPDYDKWRSLGYVVPYKRLIYKFENAKEKAKEEL